MTQTILRVIAWTMILGIVVVTDGPLGWRPTMFLPVNLERLLALFAVALMFALAYPMRLKLLAVTLTLAVCAIELGQMAMGGRHASLFDAGYKVVGVLTGLFAGYLVNSLRRTPPRRGDLARPR